jgi:hypothetical protein
VRHRPRIRRPPAVPEQYRIASDLFSAVVEDIRQLVDVDVPALESRLEAMGIRWTTGRGVT